MKFRIKHIENLGYFVQVKHGVFSMWKTIGKHTVGFGLYPGNHIFYPLKTKHECLKFCNQYEQWIYRKETITYSDVKKHIKNTSADKRPV